MRPTLDRRVGVLALAAAALATTLIPVATSFSSSATERDTTARRDLLALARRREQGNWLVDYRFTRTLANGQHLDQQTTEANRPPVHVTSSSTAVTVDFGDHTASCTSTADGPKCIDEKSGPALALSAVYAEVTRLGAYHVERAPARQVANETAQCFRLVAGGRAWPQLGDSTEQCYADDGVPLWSELVRASARDTRVAQRVERDVSAKSVSALVGRLEQEQDADRG
jgi:hypothetical protein